MITCTACGQPIPNARSNQLTCSAKCRTRRFRQNQPRPAKGSGRLRQSLMIAQPARFFPLKPDKTYGDLGKTIGVTPEQWDTTLDLLNELRGMLEPIETILLLEGDTGYTPPSNKVVEDPYLVELIDMGELVLQELGDLRARLASLRAYRGGASVVLGRHLGELDRLMNELVGQGRQFARRVQVETAPYEVEYRPEFVANLVALQTGVEDCWFAVCDQVE